MYSCTLKKAECTLKKLNVLVYTKQSWMYSGTLKKAECTHLH